MLGSSWCEDTLLQQGQRSRLENLESGFNKQSSKVIQQAIETMLCAVKDLRLNSLI